MNRFFAAVRFLTMIPVPGRLGLAEQDLAGSLPCFPVIGLLAGIVAAGAAAVISPYFAPPVTAVLVVLLLLFVSAGLHMDGLADTADGFFSSRPREKILAIMRDSHTGAMGVMAIGAVLLLKVAALASLPEGGIMLAALLMPLAGRAVLVWLTAYVPYARPEGGLASLFYQGGNRGAAWWSLLLLGGVCWLLAAEAGLVVLAVVLLCTFFFGGYCQKKIGGVTGDTLGAGCELAETVVALTLSCKPLFILWEGSDYVFRPWW
ncbi:MAG: adenosylcobinamide-GDP ribazoletransferase [Deltaproteobacteria bacterium]|nr:adenosylcobinamide-GDP ribazoletransferase [Deltaproteobacteria bacterium]